MEDQTGGCRSFWVVLAVLVGRCGSFPSGGCGSLWIVAGRCGQFRVLVNYRCRQRDVLLEVKKQTVNCFSSNTEHNFILQKVQFQVRVVREFGLQGKKKIMSGYF